jgi:hypothetical protein
MAWTGNKKAFCVLEFAKTGHEISGLNPVARSERWAAIFSRTDLIKIIIKKKRPNTYHQTKIFGHQWRPDDRKFRALPKLSQM